MHKYLNFLIIFLTLNTLSLGVNAADDIILPQDHNRGISLNGMHSLTCFPGCICKKGCAGAKPSEEPSIEDATRSLIQMPPNPSKKLELTGLLTETHLQGLKSFDGGTITLFCCYGDDDSSSAFLDYQLKISPTVINPRIFSLSLQRCGLKSPNLNDIDQFPNLHHLYLLSNLVDDVIKPKIMNLTHLQTLDMSVTRITDVTVEGLSQMTSLRTLNLSFNDRVTDKGLSYFDSNTTLNQLIIRGTGISREAYKLFKKKLKEKGSTLVIDYSLRAK